VNCSARRRPASGTTTALPRRPTKGGCETTGSHTRWARPDEIAVDPERTAIRGALAFGEALYDIRTALGLSVAELARRADPTDDDIESIEEGGTSPPPRSCAASPPPWTPTSASPPDTTSARSGSKPTPPKPDPIISHAQNDEF
jgi:hypothetical protein